MYKLVVFEEAQAPK